MMVLKAGVIVPDAGNGIGTKKGRGAVADGQSGFSLVELMIAICILSIGVLAVCSMQVSGLNGNAAARQYTDYATLAMEQMETMMAMPYSSLPADGGITGADGLFIKDGTADQVIPSGDCTVYINVAPDDILVNTTTVCVTVVWKSVGMNRSVSFQGVIPQII